MTRLIGAICLGLLISCGQSTLEKASGLGKGTVAEKNVYDGLQSRLGLDKFKPTRVEDVWIHQAYDRTANSIFYFLSGDGNFKGKAYCNPQGTDCFSVDVYEYDRNGVNGFGKQVGIY